MLTVLLAPKASKVSFLFSSNSLKYISTGPIFCEKVDVNTPDAENVRDARQFSVQVKL